MNINIDSERWLVVGSSNGFVTTETRGSARVSRCVGKLDSLTVLSLSDLAIRHVMAVSKPEIGASASQRRLAKVALIFALNFSYPVATRGYPSLLCLSLTGREG